MPVQKCTQSRANKTQQTFWGEEILEVLIHLVDFLVILEYASK